MRERDFVEADINGLDVTLLPVKTSGQHSPEVRQAPLLPKPAYIWWIGMRAGTV